MELKQLKAMREASQEVTNITGEDFICKWDGVEYSFDKGETQTHPLYLAEHFAIHMARKVSIEKQKNFHKDGEKLVNESLGKEHVEYDKLTPKEAKELAKERGIPLVTEEGKNKNKATLIADLKKSH